MKQEMQQSDGNYRAVRHLGHGGFAEVYLGDHIHLHRLAAMKVLSTPLSREDQKHFLEEARLIAHLKHPHIVRILEFGVERATPFLGMMYAPHGTLVHYLRYMQNRMEDGTALPYRLSAAHSVRFSRNKVPSRVLIVIIGCPTEKGWATDDFYPSFVFGNFDAAARQATGLLRGAR